MADGREPLLQVLAKLGLVAERDLAEAIAAVLDLPIAAAKDYPERPLLEDRFSLRFLRESRILPISDKPDGLALAMADPLDRYAEEAVALAVGRPIRRLVAVPAELEAAIDRLYGCGPGETTEDGEGAEIDGDFDAVDTDVERLRDLASEAPVIRLVNQIVSRAVEARASDIHIEPFENGLKVRFRIDGLLREVEVLPARLRPAVISRVKIMAKLNIAERRLPQDGRIKLAVRGTRARPARSRCADACTGRAVVLRILHRRIGRAGLRRAGDRRRKPERAARHPRPAARHRAGHRPDRQREDHHALCRALAPQHQRAEDPHRRGSDRIPA